MTSNLISMGSDFETGAAAFDAGLGVNDHGMQETAPGRKDWQFGWHARRVEHDIARRRKEQYEAAQQLVYGCPP
jgi:hypothetical protein